MTKHGSPAVMSSVDALDHLREGGSLSGCVVDGHLELLSGAGSSEAISFPLHCRDCTFANFSAACAHFDRPVTFSDCVFERACFFSTYFLNGVLFSRCRFREEVAFSTGVHNQNNAEFTIEDCVFDELADFEDCWFEGPVRLQRVEFVKGTNLLGNQGTPVAVSFDVPQKIDNVIGSLNLDTMDAGRRR